MNKNFYGICVNRADENPKVVYISDLEVIDENYNFNRGDLLTVFFANGNKVESPTIVVATNDTELHKARADDEGRFIKYRDVQQYDMTGAWDYGETVIFAYTLATINNEETYYWELVEGGRASNSIYGVTKLFEEEGTDLSSWMAAGESEEDSKTAITPNTIKRLFNMLITPVQEEPSPSPEPEPEPEPAPEPTPSSVIPLGLLWSPKITETETQLDDLGDLSLSGNSDGQKVTITYPLKDTIRALITETAPISHTGQLVNNGNGGPQGPLDANGEPFITRFIPNNLYFSNGNGLYYRSGSNNLPRLILNDSNNRVSIGGTNVANILLKNSTNITGGLTTSGSIVVNGSGKSCLAPEFIEGGTSLKNKYSAILKYGTVSINLDVTSKKAKRGEKDNISDATWEAIGTIGYNIDYRNNNHNLDAYYANVWECFYDSSADKIKVAVYNLSSENIQIEVKVKVLYRKKI